MTSAEILLVVVAGVAVVAVPVLFIGGFLHAVRMVGRRWHDK
jgi:hypothetical protein